MRRTWIVLIIFLVIFIGQFFLESWLSRRESRWPGLVLPVLCLLLGLLYTFSAATIPAAVVGFLLGGGLPLAVHMVIYLAGRERVRRRARDQVAKMNIQDL